MKILKSRKFLFFILLCLVASGILLAFNFSQIKTYQRNKRNQTREQDIKKIIDGVKNYISNNNNLPTTSNPDENSFLPELLLIDNKPNGGVSVKTLENMQGYFDMNIADPSGNPYFIGSSEDNIIVYSNNFENKEGKNEIYFRTLKIKSLESGKFNADEIPAH